MGSPVSLKHVLRPHHLHPCIHTHHPSIHPPALPMSQTSSTPPSSSESIFFFTSWQGSAKQGQETNPDSNLIIIACGLARPPPTSAAYQHRASILTESTLNTTRHPPSHEWLVLASSPAPISFLSSSTFSSILHSNAARSLPYRPPSGSVRRACRPPLSESHQTISAPEIYPHWIFP